MTLRELKKQLKEDKLMFSYDTGNSFVSLTIMRLTRIGTFLSSRRFLMPVYIIFRFAHKFCCWFWGINILIGSKLGGGVRFPHYGCIVVAASVKSGKNIHIFQNVTLGSSAFGKKKGYPELGNNVIIYSGSVICGNIHVGNNVIVGANSVVTKDIPDNCIVAGNPAKIICDNIKSYIDHDVLSRYFPNIID